VRVPLLVVLVLAGGGLVWFGWRLRAKPNLVTGAEDAAFFTRVAGAVHHAARIEPLAVLASSFATCTRWHCSVPGETWPNRNFAHAGTSDGSVDIEYRLFDSRTIFDVLASSLPSDGRRPWRVYFGDIPQVLAFEGLWRDCDRPELAERFRPLDDLIEDIEADSLPAYAFVEPHHHNSVLLRDGHPGSSSQHPNNNRVEPAAYAAADEDVDGRDFAAGLGLVARTYEALRTHPAVFDKTAFVVTYDEHGGMHDHVPPPTDALAPERGTLVHRLARSTYRLLIGLPVRFDFATLGPRVPAIVVSPWIPAGTVCGQRYDHASIPRTVRAVFGCPERLSRREDAAATFDHLWRGLDTPRREDLPPLDEWVRDHDPTGVTASSDGRAPALDSNHRELSRLARRVVAQVEANTRKQARTAAAGPLRARARLVLPSRRRQPSRDASEAFVQSADALQGLTRQPA
jgi:phospholipase C